MLFDPNLRCLREKKSIGFSIENATDNFCPAINMEENTGGFLSLISGDYLGCFCSYDHSEAEKFRHVLQVETLRLLHAQRTYLQ